MESENLIEDYLKIKKELTNYNDTLGEKPELIIFTKIDYESKENSKKLKEAEAYFKKLGIKTIALSNLTEEGIDTLKKDVLEKLN
jgi:GTPase involved in cell partitioning and DNA repair